MIRQVKIGIMKSTLERYKEGGVEAFDIISFEPNECHNVMLGTFYIQTVRVMKNPDN